MFKNLIKYTIGLPLLLVISISMLVMDFFIFLLELIGAVFIGLLLQGEWEAPDMYKIGLEALAELWSPIR